MAVTVFGPSYRRAAVMQASLAIVAAISGIFIGISNGNYFWLVGALLIFLVVPFTLVVIMPTNKLLLESNADRSDEENQKLLIKWGNLHAVRSVLSFIASIIYVYLGIAT